MLKSERVFHPNLKEDLEGISEVLSSAGAIGKIALIGQRYIGNALGFSPTQEQIEEMELLGVDEDTSRIYLSNYVINPKYQGNGYGIGLLKEFMAECHERGCKILEGHFKNGASLHVAKKLGAMEIDYFPNWFDTGENYTHCRLSLGK